MQHGGGGRGGGGEEDGGEQTGEVVPGVVRGEQHKRQDGGQGCAQEQSGVVPRVGAEDGGGGGPRGGDREEQPQIRGRTGVGCGGQIGTSLGRRAGTGRGRDGGGTRARMVVRE
ncbi:hypothetical protein GCM10010441_17310 [Kitasatospora paracochleata]